MSLLVVESTFATRFPLIFPLSPHQIQRLRLIVITVV